MNLRLPIPKPAPLCLCLWQIPLVLFSLPNVLYFVFTSFFSPSYFLAVSSISFFALSPIPSVFHLFPSLRSLNFTLSLVSSAYTALSFQRISPLLSNTSATFPHIFSWFSPLFRIFLHFILSAIFRTASIFRRLVTVKFVNHMGFSEKIEINDV